MREWKKTRKNRKIWSCLATFILAMTMLVNGMPFTAQSFVKAQGMEQSRKIKAEMEKLAGETIYLAPVGGGNATGYVPMLWVDGEGNPIANSTDISDRQYTLYGQDTIPTSYDGRTEQNVNGKVSVTPVKNQNPRGNCWGYAFLSCVESDILMRTGVEKDLSERHLVWFSNITQSDDENDMANEPNSERASSEYMIWNGGGNSQMASVAFARGCGMVYEEECAFPASSGYTGLGVEESMRYNSHVALKNYVELFSLSDTNADGSKDKLLKEAILKHGCVGTSMNAGSSPVEENPAFTEGLLADYVQVNGTTISYNYTDTAMAIVGSQMYVYADHAVSIIGWDDNYSKDNFNPAHKPSRDGAWLVKNSWGTNWGDEGCFWISYEDTVAGKLEAYYVEVDDGANGFDYDRKYQYDGKRMEAASTVTAANMFTARSDETLEAIMYNVLFNNSAYTFKVYVQDGNKPMENPDDGVLVGEATTSFQTDFGGIYTITLNQPVPLKEGQKFAIAVEPNSSEGGNYSYVPCEFGEGYQAIDGQTYVLVAGEWSNSTNYVTAYGAMGNIPLKALTNSGNDGNPEDVEENPGDVGTQDGKSEDGEDNNGETGETGENGEMDDEENAGDSTNTEDGEDEGINGIWIEKIQDQVYTGTAIKVTPKVYDGKDLLVLGKDYTLKYKNNKNAGKATLIVTGKGNYKGSHSTEFTILPRNIAEVEENREGETLYTLLKRDKVPAVIPQITVDIDNKTVKLKNKKDFVLTYNYSTSDTYNATKAYSVVAEGIGNYKGTITYPIHIVADKNQLISNAKIRLEYTSTIYDGRDKEPGVTVKINGQKVTSGYDVSYDNNREVGKATVKIEGNGKDLFGSKTIPFTIKGATLSSVAKVSPIESSIYDGEIKEPKVDVYLKTGGMLKQGRDYTVSYKNNINVGKASVIVTGKGGYTGKIVGAFRIQKANLENYSFKATQDKVSYSKAGATLKDVCVYNGTRILMENKDYKLVYKNNKSVGTGMVTVVGLGNYSGSFSKSFQISEANLDSDQIAMTVDNAKATVAIGKWKITVTDNYKKLTKADYEVEYYLENKQITDLTYKVPAGKYVSVKILAKGSPYTGSRVSNVYVGTQSLSKAKVTVASQEYTGEEIKPDKKDITVTVGGVRLEDGEYDIISYHNNIKCSSKATLTIESKAGTYCGQKTVAFKIVQKNVNNHWWNRFMKLLFP